MSHPLPYRPPLAICGSLAALLFAPACGGARPREQDVYHDPALRRGRVEASGEAESALLAALPHDRDTMITVGGTSFLVGPLYLAASGVRCQSIEGGGRRRLACEVEPGTWAFVPDVFGGDDPFAREAPTGVE